MPAITIIGFCLMISAGQVPGVMPETGAPKPPYRFVHEKLQQELDRSSNDGYELVLALPAFDLAILKRQSGTEHPRSYRVLNGKKAIEQALAEGYHAVPDTLDVKGGALTVVAMPADAGAAYESLLLQTKRTNTLDSEIQNARAKGFAVIGMASNDEGHVALLERMGGEPAVPVSTGTVALIAANRQETLQKELADRATAGYRLTQASSWKELVLSLERRDASVPIEYRVLSTTKSGTLEREMNAASANGFRVTPGTLHVIQKGSVMGMPAAGYEYLALMEKSAGAEPPAGYVIVAAKRMSTLAREFDDAISKGLVPIALTLGYSSQETLIVFER